MQGFFYIYYLIIVITVKDDVILQYDMDNLTQSIASAIAKHCMIIAIPFGLRAKWANPYICMVSI
ncbi:MAG: hypothetical protein SOV38_07150 [Prevotella sp.]|nr:hypothetical protein [Prevotella sp.]